MVGGISEMKIKKNLGDICFDIANILLLIIIAIITLYPLIYVFSMSISSMDAVLGLKVRLWPVGFTLSSYEKAFKTEGLGLSYLNTLWYVGVGTVLNLVITMAAAYALSRKQYFLRSFLSIYTIITMLFSGGLIPLFIVVKKLGIYNTRWAVVLIGACSVWNIIIARVFIEKNIPESLIESAKIDGYNDITIISRIVVPLSKPIISIIAMFCAVGFWNQYFISMIFAPNKEISPLQIYLISILMQNMNSATVQMMDNLQMLYVAQVKYVVIVIAILPIMMFYPFIQKYFVKGVMIGAIKE